MECSCRQELRALPGLCPRRWFFQGASGRDGCVRDQCELPETHARRGSIMRTLADVFVGKNNNLTFIRLVAALSVIYGHTSAIVAGAPADWVAVTTGYAFIGGVAVDLFFLISGFLVTASIMNGGVKNYVIARALRIYPALWVNLILVTFVLGSIVTTLSVSDYLTRGETWSYFKGLAFTFRGGFFLPGVFTTNHDQAVNGSIWSVLYEVWLYVVVLFFYILGLMRSRAVFNTLFFVLIVVLWNDKSYVPAAVSSATAMHVCLLFYIGSFLYINRDSVPISPYFLLIALFLAGITLGTDKFPYGYILLLVTFFCTVSFLKQFAWMDKWGDYSYGVYLYGWPAQQLVAWAFPDFSGTQNCLAASAIALVCGIASWHLIEKKAMRLKKVFLGKPKTSTTNSGLNTQGASI
ncbi:acyltransferase [Pseudomonas sp. MWU13-2625]|nr:acyltransferase [Pseudomonas sp. MWU13-2625]